ncbi:MAG: tol-pal system YbgF family protein, partial [Opitutales bacterium]
LARLAADRGDFETAADLLATFRDETPLHRRAIEGTLLHGEVLVETGEPSEAIEVLEDLLQRQAARGRPHARALLMMGRAEADRGNPRRAIAYYQRVYNSYRAYPSMMVDAYLASARHFEALADATPAAPDSAEVGPETRAELLRAALRTYQELLSHDRLRDFEAAWEQAEAAVERLEPLVPEVAESAVAVSETNEPESKP